jgi:hypothetical protein
MWEPDSVPAILSGPYLLRGGAGRPYHAFPEIIKKTLRRIPIHLQANLIRNKRGLSTDFRIYSSGFWAATYGTKKPGIKDVQFPGNGLFLTADS